MPTQNSTTNPAREIPTYPSNCVERLTWLTVVARTLPTKSSALAVAIVLADHFNSKSGRCNPGYEMLGERTTLCRRAVFLGVKELHAAGLIEIDHLGGPVKNRFRLVIPSGKTNPRGQKTGVIGEAKGARSCTFNNDLRVHSDAPLNDAKGARSCTPRVHADAPTPNREGTGKNTYKSKPQKTRLRPMSESLRSGEESATSDDCKREVLPKTIPADGLQTESPKLEKNETPEKTEKPKTPKKGSGVDKPAPKKKALVMLTQADVDMVIDIYHDMLPELRRVMRSRWEGSQRARDLRSRWKEREKYRSADFWRWFFAVVRRNQFWLGDNQRGWKADLGWLLKRANFDRVMEQGFDYQEREKQLRRSYGQAPS